MPRNVWTRKLKALMQKSQNRKPELPTLRSPKSHPRRKISKRSFGDCWVNVVDDFGLALAIALALGTMIVLAASIARADVALDLEYPETAQQDGALMHLEPSDIDYESCPDAEAITAGVRRADRSGVWMPDTTANCLLQRLTLLQELADYAELLEERMEWAMQRRNIFEAQLELGEAQLSASEQRERELAAQLQKAESWHRKPGFWFAIGATSIVALEVVALLIFTQVAD